MESIAYIPTAKDNYLRYPNSLANQKTVAGDPHAIRKFDEYGDLTINKERERLNDFALMLKGEPKTQGYIIAYAGRRARVAEAGIDRARVVTVDGGYREQLMIELFLGAKDGAEPVPSPTLCPSEVRIIKDGKARNKRRLVGSQK